MRDTNFALTKEVLQKNQENELLRDGIGKKEEELGMATMGLDRMEMREARLLHEVELLKQQNKLLEDKVMKLRTDLQESLNNRHSESYLLLENEALKEDVGRLVKMLQTTKEVRAGHPVQELRRLRGLLGVDPLPQVRRQVLAAGPGRALQRPEQPVRLQSAGPVHRREGALGASSSL